MFIGSEIYVISKLDFRIYYSLNEHNFKKREVGFVKKLVSILFVPFLLFGCSNEQSIQTADASIDEKNRLDIEDMIKNKKEVYTGTILLVDNELLVAIQVNPWIGFKEQKIEKRLQKEIEEKYPDLNVLVSTDYKMLWESQKLLNEEDNQKILDEMKSLKKLAKEET